MDLDTALADVRQVIEAKRPDDLPVHDFLRQLVESYVPDEPTELSEGQAEAILLARGLLARQQLHRFSTWLSRSLPRRGG
jgi:hypothetical protein